MKGWQEDLLDILDGNESEQEIFGRIEAAARALGFDYVAYGLRVPLPVSNPRTVLLNNYPEAWQRHYAQENFIDIDPTVLHGRRSQSPILWCDTVFQNARKLWEDAQAAGLRVGWAQSCLNTIGIGGMLTLARSSEPLTEAELAGKEIKMRWLANISHLACAKISTSRLSSQLRPALTAREIEVLRWTADGKSSSDISAILNVSLDTVNFHIKNAVAKLQSANRTAAVVRAAMLGILN